MKKILIALTLAMSLLAASAGNFIYVASPEASDAYELPDGSMLYLFVPPLPVTAGVYVFQESRDMGASWRGVLLVDNTDPDNLPFVSYTVNPAITAPYVWYRFVPYVAPPAARVRPHAKPFGIRK